MLSATVEVRARRTRGMITIVESLLIFVPLLVLGAAIGWPGSLGDPAGVALPLPPQ
jgi:hypothetical protein